LNDKPKIPVKLSGAEVKKTKLGWKARCQRCKTWIKFGKHEIETTGTGFEHSAYSLVASGYIFAKEHNDLAEDYKEEKVDWIDYMRRQRRLYYRMTQIPNSAFSMQSTIKLTCEQCNTRVIVNVAFGEEIALKELPKDYEALVKLGIKKKDNIQHFQLRTGKLAKDFVEKIRFADKEIKLLEKTKVKVKELINTIASPSDIVAGVLRDVTATATASAEAQMKNLKLWMRTHISRMENLLFIDLGSGMPTTPEPRQITTDLHSAGFSDRDETSLRQEIEKQREIHQQRTRR